MSDETAIAQISSYLLVNLPPYFRWEFGFSALSLGYPSCLFDTIPTTVDVIALFLTSEYGRLYGEYAANSDQTPVQPAIGENDRPFVSPLPFFPDVKHAFKTAQLPIAMLTVFSASFSSRGTDRQSRDLEDDRCKFELSIVKANRINVLTG
ncbi:12665_t:CDS:2 [Acaulospora morrowiae]|uniref:12665_t:CDS:1 n=1 Tax=Acaulospora morrowiae TaxID=94023 RepID=A0A9N9AAI4_9GLOM|nr:12665_t:CDS:2 [Acaulospora morrowiae]